MVEGNTKGNRLQRRIAKAVKEGRWAKAKALVHLLTKSFYAKLLAVFRVTHNKGGNTPGVDKIVWSNPADKLKAALNLKTRGYRTKLLRRIYIPKKNGKKRPLSIPVMHDRAMQTLYKMALEPMAETVYHKGICAKRTFARLGTFIYWQLKRWAKYQHGNKNRRWIYHRYFHDNHFTDQRTTKKGVEHNRLYRIAYVPIQYHVKVKTCANPFLPEYDRYFYKIIKWREDLAKDCKQITTFIESKNSDKSRDTPRRDGLKSA